MISMTSDNRDVMTPLQVVFHSRGVTVVLQVMVRESRHATTESSSDTSRPTSIDIIASCLAIPLLLVVGSSISTLVYQYYCGY